ncbi:MAG: superoxide dismutase [Chloroflexi bacterium]|nr:superoxide dismutase [Chloroflexota bacterium]
MIARTMAFGAAALLLLLLTIAVPTTVAKAFPEVIPLPNGFAPEGVATGRGPVIFAGSLNNGAIYRADLRTGEGDVFIEGEEGAVAVGLSFDKRANTLFVSGGPTGLGRVYDASSGALLAEYQLGTPGATFINDVVATREAAYFTDSRASVFYRVPLGPGGRLLPNAAVETIAFSDNYPFDPAAFNSNGIVATSNGRWLIVANSGAQAVYRVDPDTGEATEIDLGGDALPNADGLVLLGRTLYVVQNSSNQIAVVELSADYTSGEVVDTITDDDFRVPTTAAVFGNALYAVNARFGTTPGPDVEYEIVRVER